MICGQPPFCDEADEVDEVVGVLVPKMAPLNGGYTMDIP